MTEAITEGSPAGSGGDSWQSLYLAGTELADNESLQTIKDVPSLAKAFVETKALVGKRGDLSLPKEDATPDEWAVFYDKLGRPASPDQYALVKPENLPETFPYAPELETAFRKWSHQAGLTAKQAQTLYDAYLATSLEQFQQAQAQQKARLEELKGGLQQKWGDKFEANLIVARKAQKFFAPDGSEGLAALDEVLGNDPRLIELFYNIGSKMGEAELVTGGLAGADSHEAKLQQARELMRSEAYLNKNHLEHKAVLQKVRSIYEAVYAEPGEGEA